MKADVGAGEIARPIFVAGHVGVGRLDLGDRLGRSHPGRALRSGRLDDLAEVEQID